MMFAEPLAGLGLFALVLLAAIGGPAQRQLAMLCNLLGGRRALFAAGMLPAFASASLHGWAGAILEVTIPDRWKFAGVALVLLLVVVRLVFPVQLRPPAEPTYSLGAITLALLARQLGDAAGLIVMSAVMIGLPLHWGIGVGAASGCIAMGIGCMKGEWHGLRPLSAAHWALSFPLACYAIYIVYHIYWTTH